MKFFEKKLIAFEILVLDFRLVKMDLKLAQCQ